MSGNDSTGYGAGLVILGLVRLVHCTVSGNQTGSLSSALYVRGVLDMENTLIAGNHGTGHECAAIRANSVSFNRGAPRTDSHNLVSDGSCESEQPGDPLLRPVGRSGDPSWTHALPTHSEAIDAISAPDCRLPCDQRGEGRPAGAGLERGACDVGAFEAQARP
jgi:hypothetical protein